MASQIKEADWRVLREIRVKALERFCERVLSEVSGLAAQTGRSSHQRYLAVYKLLQKRDRELAGMFNNPKRSVALLQLAAMRSHNLFTEEEFACFSHETQATVQMLLDLDG